ncbi:MAG: enoyl-CoA hydratase/isomerase family protein [Actinobacteria bacterium]|nr:enoyl-CoA hydratase/isomerase family protein [Actinomycetota bacterium]
MRIDRPPVNALSAEVLGQIDAALDLALGDERARALVVSGGDKVFAAGGDIKEMMTLDPISATDYISFFQRVLTRLEGVPMVTVAAVNGYALGGGCELALACDLRICAEEARFGQPEINLGVIPGAGGTQRLPRLVGVGRAKELIYSGRIVDSQEAAAIGLVNQVVSGSEVLRRAGELAAAFAGGPLVALRAAKEAIQTGIEADLATGLLIERQAFASLFATEDQRTGMTSFIDKGPGKAKFTGR